MTTIWTDERITALEQYATEQWIGRGDAYCDTLFKQIAACKSDSWTTAMQNKRETIETFLAADITATTFSPTGERMSREHLPLIQRLQAWLADDIAGRHEQAQP